jgi:hypothetical protein
MANPTTPITAIGDEDPTTIIKIAAGELQLTPNMNFGGNIDITGNPKTDVDLRGDGHVSGATLTIETPIAEEQGTIKIETSNSRGGLVELTSNPVPVSFDINVFGSDQGGPASGIKMDFLSSTSAGGEIDLSHGFAEIATIAASFSVQNNIFTLFDGVGAPVDKIFVKAANGADPLKVGVAGGNTYIYNADPKSIPGLGMPAGGGQHSFVTTSDIIPLPMHV